MQSSLAVILYLVFLAIGAVLLKRRRPEASAALWLPQLWFMISASRPVYLWIYSEPVVQKELDSLSGNPVDRAILSVLLALGLIILLRRNINWRGAVSGNKWVFALFLFMGASILWSDYPAVSFKRWVRSAGDLVMVLIVLSEKRPLEAIGTLVLRLSVVLLPLSIILIKYFPHLGVAYTSDGLSTMWIGVTTHKNELGVLALICGIFLFWKMLEAWRNRKVEYLDITLMLMVFWLLRGSTTSDSKTSTVAFLLSCCILLSLHVLRPGPRLVGGLIAGTLTLFGVFIALNAITEGLADASLYENLVRATGRDPTLTGRTDLWKDLIGYAAENPVLGRGYGSFWVGNLSYLWDKFIWLPTQAHNGYLDVVLELGIIGLLLLFGAILSAYRSIIRHFERDASFAGLRLVFFIMILVHNMTESSFLRGSSYLWDVFLLFAVTPLAQRSALPQTVLRPAAVKETATAGRGARQPFVRGRRSLS